MYMFQKMGINLRLKKWIINKMDDYKNEDEQVCFMVNERIVGFSYV